jgi:tetratricopeptide (TPR) repeat protein
MATSTGPRNPYIIGRPITEPERFYGRESLFQFIEDTLNQGARVILLHGQRRIGKSSVLAQIPHFVRLEKFCFIPLSLEGKSQKPLSDVLYELANDVKGHLCDELNLPVDDIRLPSRQEFHDNVQIFAEDFLPQVYRTLGNRNPVLLLDEFDVLGDYSKDKDTGIGHFFPYLQSILYQQKKLFIIPVVGRRLDDMPNLLNLFREAPNRQIGLMSRRSVVQLITKPAQGIVDYEADAIDAIWELSAGHPYFTQVICFALFANARAEQRWRVTRTHVEHVIDRAIEIGEAGLAWFRDGLPTPERVVFSAVAEVDVNTGTKDPLLLLQDYGISQIELLRAAKDRLIKWGFIQEVRSGRSWVARLFRGRSPFHSRLKVTVKLVCYWLTRRYPLHQEIWELEKLDPDAQRLYEATLSRQHDNSLLDSLKLKQVLDINPDHFSALFDLAESYLDAEEFGQAIERYERAYRVDQLRAREGFVQALIGDGSDLILQEELELAELRFRKALELEPENGIVQTVLQVMYEAQVLNTDTPSLLMRLRQLLGIGPEDLGSSKAVGQVLQNRYRITRTLSRDEFGQTYLAQDTSQFDTPICVVKSFDIADANPNFLQQIRRQFDKEVQTLKKLGVHDRIPDLLDAFEESQQLFLVYEYIEGHSLTDELEPGHRWCERKVIELLQQVLEILGFVHGLRVIHRNLKPDNLIRRKSDQNFVLIGFDTAIREIQTLQKMAETTSVTIAIGTPGYVPSEQLSGRPRFSSDIYSLGIIGIQALTGMSPGQFQEDLETGEIVWQTQAPQVNPQLAIILSKMIRYSPKERYQSAHHVLQELQPII